MNIGLLGAVQSASPFHTKQVKSASNNPFHAVFQQLIQGQEKSAAGSKEDYQLNEHQLEQMLRFLKADDISQLEAANPLMENESHQDSFETAKDLLSITDEQLIEILQQLINKLINGEITSLQELHKRASKLREETGNIDNPSYQLDLLYSQPEGDAGVSVYDKISIDNKATDLHPVSIGTIEKSSERFFQQMQIRVLTSQNLIGQFALQSAHSRIGIQQIEPPGTNNGVFMESLKADQQLLHGIDLEIIMKVLSDFLSSSPSQQLSILNDVDIGSLTKVLKVYDLLTESQNTDQKAGEIKQILKNFQQQLTQLLQKNTTSSWKTDYLQKTFAEAVNSVMENKQIKQTADTGKIMQINDKAASLQEAKMFHEIAKQSATEIKAASESGGTKENFSESGDKSRESFAIQQFPVSTKAEQITLMLDQSGKKPSAADLLQQFNAMLAKSNFSKENGIQKLFVKLHPEHLGTLRIELIQKDQILTAKILTTTGHAKDLLEGQLNGLKTAFSLQNIPVERVEISQQIVPQDRYFQKEQQQQQQQQQQHGRQQQQQQQEERDFIDSFEAAMLNTEV
ncbi:flagellar hook-length control protein FliK [Bacillaceae bacterium Marseille-Q3522]|nr:flagellar hook-length control protein FliK [Bacillaceae bacterium Marseille-Q3522]